MLRLLLRACSEYDNSAEPDVRTLRTNSNRTGHYSVGVRLEQNILGPSLVRFETNTNRTGGLFGSAGFCVLFGLEPNKLNKFEPALFAKPSLLERIYRNILRSFGINCSDVP